MMGQIEEWFYKSLAGIKPDINNPGFKHFFIEPCIVGDLTHVDCSYNSIYGTIEVKWTLDKNTFTIEITVPVNTTATFYPPFGNMEEKHLESGKHVFVINR
jgi:hypothetical protein